VLPNTKSRVLKSYKAKTIRRRRLIPCCWEMTKENGEQKRKEIVVGRNCLGVGCQASARVIPFTREFNLLIGPRDVTSSSMSVLI
jgi:hypothetical protein